ncbi:hypothetical protein EDEG_00537 [Edhazardia aedis USNM 41457]|uniref:UBC core domain-containing protein n=1 Tax=Edhazardia aedis (strain USNM 41457) TaxID=1003232 RepID=J9DIP4_EDHAE|nr:hypothetical protein EDEG_00537 [Edhazardia aedis USNM 41457]|eukprot:EJW01237.1 hypothetical protein EDEG_00537 [Edhazardia aedis USNM 41457]
MAKISSTAIRRLQAESRRVKADGLSIGFYAFPTPNLREFDDVTWEIYIKGTDNSVYEGTYLHARIKFPMEYPIHPPTLVFVTEMFHPNIYSDGKVCISILHVADDDPTSYETPDEKWTPVQCINTIVLSVISILNEPNVDSPANVDASKMLNEEKNKYEAYVRKLAQEKGTKFEDIKLNEIPNDDQLYIRKLFNKH